MVDNYLYIDESKKTLEKIELLNQDTNIIFEDLTIILEDLNNDYKSDNNVEINNIEQLLFDKMNIFSVNNYNNEKIIERAIVTYSNLSSEVTKNLKNIIE